MSNYDTELLDAARKLIARRVGQKGKIPTARIRRSISTSYYAIFHFLLEEAGIRLIGSSNNLRRRRRILARTFTHTGIKTALDRVRGAIIDQNVAEFFRWPSAGLGPLPSPIFAQNVAKAFADAQAKRHDADYDLNKSLSATDARITRVRVGRAIKAWRSATTPDDKDFKKSLAMLMLLKGQLRKES